MIMDTIMFDSDIAVFCVNAKSFPEGVQAAHQTLHAKYPPASGRRYYGISSLHDGDIKYKAAIEFGDLVETRDPDLEKFVIRKGKYASKVIRNFMEDIPSIGRAFRDLLKDVRIDPNGYCLEEYFNDKDVRCLIKLKDD
jgi:hypothetical protein